MNSRLGEGKSALLPGALKEVGWDEYKKYINKAFHIKIFEQTAVIRK